MPRALFAPRLSAALAVCLSTAAATAGEILPWSSPSASIEMAFPLERIYPAPNGRLVGIREGNPGVVIIDTAAKEVFDPITLPAAPGDIAVSPDPFFEEYYVLTRETPARLVAITGENGAYERRLIPDEQLERDFRNPEIAYMVLPQTRAFDSGPTLAIYDRAGYEGAGYLRLLFPNTTSDIKPEAYPSQILDVGLGQTAMVLLEAREQVALLNVQEGFLTDNILLDGLRFSDPSALAVVTVAKEDSDRKIALVANVDEGVLTLLDVSTGRTPRLSAPLQIGIDGADLARPAGAKVLLAADRELTQIIVGAAGSDRAQLFRRIRGGLERLERVLLSEPVRDIAMISLRGQTGPQGVAYLSADGRTVHLRAIGDLPRQSQTRGIDRIAAQGVIDRADVVTLQRSLNSLGYTVAVDGILGQESRRALVDFQSRWDLEQTGQPDPETLKQLTLAAAGEMTATRSLSLDAADPLQVQRLLATLGYRVGAIDGELGALTSAALRAFQADEGLAATGALDAATVAALNVAVEQQFALPEADTLLPRYAAFLSARAGGTVAPERLMTLGVAQDDLSHPCFGLNFYPPDALWENSVRLAHLLGHLDRALGAEAEVISAFRSPAYHRCIVEPNGESHTSFAAIDVRMPGADDSSFGAATAVVMEAVESLENQSLVTAAVRRIGSDVHIEPELGAVHVAIASHTLDSLGCEFAKDDVDEAARLLSGGPASGRLVQVIRAPGGDRDVFAVTIDMHGATQEAENVRQAVVAVSGQTADGKTGHDAFVMTRRTSRLDPSCARNRIIP